MHLSGRAASRPGQERGCEGEPGCPGWEHTEGLLKVRAWLDLNLAQAAPLLSVDLAGPQSLPQKSDHGC